MLNKHPLSYKKHKLNYQFLKQNDYEEIFKVGFYSHYRISK